MNRTAALVLILLLWAALYLPGLGTPELKGEEGRRILPAIAMLETGDWIVPYLNGEPYLRKPPLVNWLIAASFRVTGERSEWAARLPSVLAVLALGLTLVWTGSRWLSPGGGFMAAVFTLTSAAFLDKGRLAEIEAVYVALAGIAFAFWLAAWACRETGWRLWLWPGVFLGLAMLAKGPGHLPLFYGVVIPVLWVSGERRQLWSGGHGVALVLVFGIFAAWALPYFRATAVLGAGGVWASQAGNTLGGGSLKLGEWLPNFPRAFSNGLPWILFALFWWNRRVLAALDARHERLGLLIRAARWPLFLGFIGLMAVPGILPRYTLALWPAAALLLAASVPAIAEVFPRTPGIWRGINRALALVVLAGAVASPWIVRPAAFRLGSWFEWAILVAVALAFLYGAFRMFRPRADDTPCAPSLAAASALCAAGGVAVYAVAALPKMTLRDDLRPLAAEINAALTPGKSLTILAQGYEPLYFYLKLPCVFPGSPGKIARNAEQILFPKKMLKKVKSRWPEAVDALHWRRRGKKDFFLLKLAPESGKNAGPGQPPAPVSSRR